MNRVLEKALSSNMKIGLVASDITQFMKTSNVPF